MNDLRKTLKSMSRAKAESYFSGHTRSEYMGNNTMICQILGNMKLFALADDIGFTPHMVFDGFWEYWLTRYFAEAVKPGDCVIDIGANQGYYTLLASELVGSNGKVISIEPNPEVFSKLLASVQINGFYSRVNPMNVALAFEGGAGLVPFWVPHRDCKNGRFIFPEDNHDLLEAHGNIIEVEAIDLQVDQFDRVDFIKIDVEGAELAVLKQIRPIIDQFRPGIVCEVNFGRNYSYNDLIEAVGTDDLLYLDFDSKIRKFNKDLAENENINEDWLICLERNR